MAYAELADPALRRAGDTYVARGLPEETYESGEKTRTVVIEFELVEAGNLVYRSVHVRMLVAAGRLGFLFVAG